MIGPTRKDMHRLRTRALSDAPRAPYLDVRTAEVPREALSPGEEEHLERRRAGARVCPVGELVEKLLYPARFGGARAGRSERGVPYADNVPLVAAWHAVNPRKANGLPGPSR